MWRWLKSYFSSARGAVGATREPISRAARDAEIAAVKKARAKAIKRAAACYGRDDRGYGAACMEAEALTRTELMLTVGR